MEDVCTTIYPMYILSKIFGQVHYKINGNVKKRRITQDKLLIIVNILFHIILITYAIYVNDVHNNYKVDGKRKFVLIFHINASIVLTLMVPIINLYYLKTQILIIEKIIAFDSNLNNMGIFLDAKRTRKRIILLVCSFYISLILSCIFGSNLGNEYRNKIIYNGSIILRRNARLVMIFQIHVWMIVIAERFDVLRRNLFQIANNKEAKFWLRQVLTRTIQLHQELCWITRNVNKLYEIQILTSATLTFITFILDTYSLIQMVHSNNLDMMEMAEHGYSIFISSSQFLLSVYFFSEVSNNVSYRYISSLKSLVVIYLIS